MAFVAAARAGDGQTTTTSSLSITIPAGAASGQAAVLVVDADGSPSLTTPTGWTLDRTDTGSGNSTAWVFKKTLAGGDPGASVSLSFGASVRCGALMLVHSGQTLTGLQIDVTTDSSATGNYVAPTLSSVPATSDLLLFMVRRRSGAAGNITIPAPYTSPANGDFANAYAAGVNTFGDSGYLEASAGGTVGGETATSGVTSIGYTYLVALPTAGATINTANQDASRGWDTVATVLGTQITAPAQDASRGWDSATAELQHQFNAANQDAGRGWDTVTAELTVAPRPRAATQHTWSMFSRTAGYALDLALPILAAKFVRRHMGVSTAVASTPYTPARWASLQPGCGIELWRDGRQEFTGRLTSHEVDWAADNGRGVINVEAAGDEILLADRLVFPDPLRADDDQTVNDYWKTRTAGTAVAKVASTAMLQLISDQAGATCRASRQISGLTLGADPAVGLSRIWSALFDSAGEKGVLDQLATMSVASGVNLGLRMTTTTGALVATIVQPRNLASTIRFSADLSNLVGFTYRAEAPTVTEALAAGQGDLHLRLRKLASTSDPLATAWGRKIWKYIDRRDTADLADLTDADNDAISEGAPTVALKVTLTDSQAATYGTDWQLGDSVTVYVGLPGQTRVATVADVVREILFEISEKGAEKITPAIGSYDAKALLPTPTQKRLAAVGAALRGLISRK